MLLTAAHAAAMAGMGAPCHLLKKAFYWPSLDEDARQYAWTCKIQRRLRNGRKRRAPPQGNDDEVATAADTANHGPAKLHAPARGPSAVGQRVKRRPRALRGAEPRPDVAHEEGSHSAHPPYQPAPVAELAQFAARQPLPQPTEPSALLGPDLHPWPVTSARIRGPRTCPHTSLLGEENNEGLHLRGPRPGHQAPPPGAKNNEGLRQRFEKLTEAMREAADRMRALDHMCEMMARQRESSRPKENPDQAAPDQTPPDQAGLIAEGDVPSQEHSGCGLPDARTRPCPH